MRSSSFLWGNGALEGRAGKADARSKAAARWLAKQEVGNSHQAAAGDGGLRDEQQVVDLAGAGRSVTAA
jgi:hypothetical protein